MDNSNIETILNALKKLENQLRDEFNSDTRIYTGNNIDNAPLTKSEASLFEKNTIKQLEALKIIVTSKRIVKGFWTEKFFVDSAEEYKARKEQAKNFLDSSNLLNTTIEITQLILAPSENEAPKANDEEEAVKSFTIENLMIATFEQLETISKEEKCHFTLLGSDKWSDSFVSTQTHKIVFEISANFLELMDKVIKKLIHAMIFCKLTMDQPCTYMIITCQSEDEITNFISNFNAFYADDTQIDKLNQYGDSILRLAMLKQLIIEGNRLLIMNKPFYLRKSQLNRAYDLLPNILSKYNEHKQFSSNLRNINEKLNNAVKEYDAQLKKNAELKNDQTEFKRKLALYDEFKKNESNLA